MTERGKIGVAAAVIIASGSLAYANSLGGPFILDDAWNVLGNPSIRHLGEIGRVFSPPAGIGVSGRPLYNLSLALNYAVGGRSVLGYHLFNLGLHLLAALALFGIVRRSLGGAIGPALAAALLWALDPVQTASVTYVSERSEVLAALFCLLSLYGFIRGAGGCNLGFVGAVVACWAGMASKETMVAAPVLILAYDRSFLSGSFREAWRARWPVHLALASGWLLLLALIAGSGAAGVGYGPGSTAWSYALTECRAVAGYLRLLVWPHPLVFDYDLPLAHRLVEVWPEALLVASFLAAAVAALLLRPRAGFAAFAFFLLLAPTSSFLPIAGQPMAENRLYLALAGPLGLGAFLLFRRGGQPGRIGVFLLAAAFLLLTRHRNFDYGSALRLWTDTVAKAPGSARAHASLGVAFHRSGRKTDALRELAEAVRLRPEDPILRLLHGNLLTESGREAEARAEYREALRINPFLEQARRGIGRSEH